jgi:hypothetical protein
VDALSHDHLAASFDADHHVLVRYSDFPFFITRKETLYEIICKNLCVCICDSELRIGLERADEEKSDY